MFCPYHRITLTILFVTLPNVNSRECDSFRNVKVKLFSDERPYRKSTRTVNGCLELDDEVSTAYFEHQQHIRRLGEGSVRHLPRVYILWFNHVDLEVVEPYAFKDLPHLRELKISNTNLKEITKDVFNTVPSLEDVLIDKNKINYIERHAFANMPRLQWVYASHNSLESWNIEWFENCTNIRRLIFSNNKIHTIPSRAFFALSKLKIIDFNHNEINSIQPGAFRDVDNLASLDLSFNRITVIGTKVFPSGINIRRLEIQANYLNYLSTELLENMNVDDVVLDFNPWTCPCLNKIHKWIYTTKGTMTVRPKCKENDNVPVCANPNVWLETCSEHVDEELTRRYIGYLRNISTVTGIHCARLDRVI